MDEVQRAALGRGRSTQLLLLRWCDGLLAEGTAVGASPRHGVEQAHGLGGGRSDATAPDLGDQAGACPVREPRHGRSDPSALEGEAQVEQRGATRDAQLPVLSVGGRQSPTRVGVQLDDRGRHPEGPRLGVVQRGCETGGLEYGRGVVRRETQGSGNVGRHSRHPPVGVVQRCTRRRGSLLPGRSGYGRKSRPTRPPDPEHVARRPSVAPRVEQGLPAATVLSRSPARHRRRPVSRCRGTATVCPPQPGTQGVGRRSASAPRRTGSVTS